MEKLTIKSVLLFLWTYNYRYYLKMSLVCKHAFSFQPKNPKPLRSGGSVNIFSVWNWFRKSKLVFQLTLLKIILGGETCNYLKLQLNTIWLYKVPSQNQLVIRGVAHLFYKKCESSWFFQRGILNKHYAKIYPKKQFYYFWLDPLLFKNQGDEWYNIKFSFTS